MLRRLRKGEWIAVGGLVGLLATLFLRWFNAEIEIDGVPATGSAPGAELWDAAAPMVALDTAVGWSGLGRPWADFLVVAVLAVAVMLAMTLRARPGRPTYGAVVSLIVAGFLTFLVTVLTAIRVLLARPSTDEALPEGVRVVVTTTPGPGTWIGLASLIVILIGLWVAVADDRTDAPDSAFDPPAPRPVPDAAPAAGPDAPAPTPEP